MPPDQVWEYLTRPELRAYLHNSDRQMLTGLSEGKIGPGSIYQCYHGDKEVAHGILEWEPFERIVTRETAPTPFKGTHYFGEYRLRPSDTGARLSLRFTKPRGPFLGRALMRLMAPVFGRTLRANLQRFKREVHREIRPGEVDQGSS